MLKTTYKCIHCDEETLSPIILGEKVFCCYGCRSVYEILNSHDYKDLIDSNISGYEYLDAYKKEGHITFFIEGMQCLSCIWLFEKLPVLCEGITKIETNYNNQTLKIEFNEVCTPSKVASVINSLGYEPVLLNKISDQEKMQSSLKRKELIRIGVAGFCAGNIMLYSIANYAGAGGTFKVIFDYISLFLCFISIIYSGSSFVTKAFYSLKQKALSIDLPLSMAIISGFLISIYSLIKGSGEHYFDTISILIFLILISKYFVNTSTRKSLAFLNEDSPFGHSLYKVLNNNNEFVDTSIDKLAPGDRILITKNSVIPVDATLWQGQSYFNNTVINGESLPQFSKKGDTLYAGAINYSNEVVIKATHSYKDSKFALVLDEIKKQSSSSALLSTKGEKIASIVSSSILFCALISFIYFYNTQGFYTALEIALGLIIISCPCALGMATPLAFIRGLKVARDNDLFIKDACVLERLNDVENIFFDKTGTLTQTRHTLVDNKPLNKLNPKHLSALTSLCNFSSHPLAKSLLDEIPLSKYDNITLTCQEKLGEGVTGQIGQSEYFLGKPEVKKENFSSICFKINDVVIAHFDFSCSISKETSNAVRKLAKDYNIHIISGDNTSVVKNVASKLNIDHSKCYSDQSVHDKKQIILSSPKSLMVGDGVNDSLALCEALVSFAIRGPIKLSLKVSDVYSSNEGISPLIKLFEIAKGTKRIIKINLLFSFFYNLIGILLVLNGLIGPLAAAFLMPLSSITVVFSTLFTPLKLSKEI